MCPAFKNPNRLVELLIEGGLHWTVQDMVKQARILDRKIDLNWSKKRMHEEHNNWTRDIMKYEIDSVEEIDYNYPEFKLMDGLELIKSNREVFEEGTVMKHCLYTNYAHRMKDKTYFAFRYDKNGVRATLGIALDQYIQDPHVEFNQMYGRGNSVIDSKIHKEVKEWLAQKEVQEYFLGIFRNQHKVKNNKFTAKEEVYEFI